MFMGEFSPSLDEKGRLAIPARLRKAFGEESPVEKLIVTHGFDKCIMAFRESDWVDFVENKLVPLSQSDPKHRMSIRFLIGGAGECELDKQGRVLLPGNLLNYAGITDEVTVLGLYNKIEIWSKATYESYKPNGEELNIFAGDLGF